MQKTPDTSKSNRIIRRIFRIPIIVGLTLTSLWCGVIWSVHVTEKISMEDLRRETSALSQLFARHADTTFQTFDLGLKSLRSGWLARDRNLEQLIATHVELLPGAFVQTGITDAKGNVVFTLPVQMKTSVNIADRDYFQAHLGAKKDELFVGRPIVGRISGKWSIPISRPIYQDGKFAGIVYVTADPEYFVRFYWKANVGRNGVATMVRDTGEIMARSSQMDLFIGERIKPTPYTDAGAPLQGHFMRAAQTDQVVRFYGYVRMPQYGLSVLIGPSLSEGMAMAKQSERQSIIAAGFLTIAILLVAFVIRQGSRRESAIKQALSESEERFRSIFANMLEGVALHSLVLNEQGRPINYRLIQINPAFEGMIGIKREEAIGRLGSDVYGMNPPPFLDMFAEVAQTRQAASYEYRSEALNKDFVVQIVSPKQDLFVVVLADVTERAEFLKQREADWKVLQEQYRTITQLHAKLEDQVVHDPLTGLHNRRYLADMMPREMARAQRQNYPVAFIMFDIDKFKSINDTYGHAVGDVVLKVASRVLNQNARETDFLFRLGGEEFLMVLPHMNSDQALEKANACRLAVAAEATESNGSVIRVTISAGVAVYPMHGDDVDALINRADKALYAAKGNGRNRVELAD